MKFALLGALLAASLLGASAEPPLYAVKKTPAAAFSWMDEIRKKVSVLKNDRGTRLPMILWEPDMEQTDLPQDVYKDLLARELTQHLHIDEKMIPMAKALQEAGLPVIMMQGIGGQWPANLAGDPKEWAHQFDAGYVPNPKDPVHACPAIATGWAMNARNVGATLQKFKDAGVTVDAVWMDWEGDPLGGPERYEQALHCTRCRETLPPGVLANAKTFSSYCWRRDMDLGGAYLAAPVLEIFPACSVTNWRVMDSTPERPARNWEDQAYPPIIPPFFNTSNPVAYGNTISWSLWKPGWKLNREHVDEFYTYLLLNEVSDDGANRQTWTPERKSAPWVCRWCPDDPSPKIPIMTRKRYREVLRHIWLRGTSGMQIFNPRHDGYEDMAVAEVQDAVAVYDEMLAYRDFLEHGTPLCFDLPKMQDNGVLWSGLRWKNRAIVRTFKQGGGMETVTIEPWPGRKIALEATGTGRTWELRLKGGRVRVVN